MVSDKIGEEAAKFMGRLVELEEAIDDLDGKILRAKVPESTRKSDQVIKRTYLNACYQEKKKSHNLTYESLANRLGISAQAVALHMQSGRVTKDNFARYRQLFSDCEFPYPVVAPGSEIRKADAKIRTIEWVQGNVSRVPSCPLSFEIFGCLEEMIDFQMFVGRTKAGSYFDWQSKFERSQQAVERFLNQLEIPKNQVFEKIWCGRPIKFAGSLPDKVIAVFEWAPAYFYSIYQLDPYEN